MPAMLVGPMLKVLGIAVVILGLIAIGEWHGRGAVQQEWDAAITKQATLTASELIERARQDASGIVRYITVTGEAQARTKIIEREVVKYVASPSEKCVLSPEFVWTFDTVSGLLDPSENGLPASTNPTGNIPESASATVTDAEVLRAYETAIIQYRDLWLAYNALREWTRNSMPVPKP